MRGRGDALEGYRNVGSLGALRVFGSSGLINGEKNKMDSRCRLSMIVGVDSAMFTVGGFKHVITFNAH